MAHASCTDHHPKTISLSRRPFSWKVSGLLPPLADGTPNKGIAGPVVGVSRDFLLIGGGSNFPLSPPWEGGQKKYHRQVYVYQRAADSLQPVRLPVPAELPYQVAYPACCSTDMGLVVAGGENEQGPLSKVLLLNWDAQKKKLQVENLPDLPFALTSGMLTAVGNTLYYAGGNGASGTSDAFFKLNLDSLGTPNANWQALPPLPEKTAYGVLYGLDSLQQVFLVGGRKSVAGGPSELYANVYQFDINRHTWNKKAPLPFPLSAHSGVTFDAETLLVFSGDRGETFLRTEALLLQIAAATEPQKKAALIREKNKLQASHPGFVPAVLAYQVNRDSWSEIDTIPFPGQVTTTAVIWDDQVIIPCGEIRAAVRTANIITGTLK
ncbi:hypothetical protein [Arachidicoccus terrestris]|uniref:hypothetical protein n=1 Tax=Arachidicoccus terrestris TaxID=2875539 RepID=UPI001CC63990|nr:hypothetical protein [Arachidicoccus terrestris]UAY55957.1 hypothetical protein K9M52_02685 [Arachidicoccus terrestris]